MNHQTANSNIGTIQQIQSQRRAKYAFKCINEAQKLDNDTQKEIKTYVQKLPSMIQMNGFGQAIAFYRAHKLDGKGGMAYQTIYSWLSKWLIEESIYTEDLMTSICNNNMQKYQLATAETQALLVWMKKFARATLDAGSDQNSTR